MPQKTTFATRFNPYHSLHPPQQTIMLILTAFIYILITGRKALQERPPKW